MSEPDYSFEIIDADEYASFNLSLESNEFLYFELKPVDGVVLGKSDEMDLAKLNPVFLVDLLFGSQSRPYISSNQHYVQVM